MSALGRTAADLAAFLAAAGTAVAEGQRAAAPDAAGAEQSPRPAPPASFALQRAFVEALHADFLAHGAATIARVREEDPAVYVKVCTAILPKELKIERAEELTEDQLDQRIRQLAHALGLEVGAGHAPHGEAEPARPH